MQAQKRAALLMNAWVSASGGDQRLISVFSRIAKHFVLDLYTSIDGKDFAKQRLQSVNIITAPESLNHGNVFLTYLGRTKWLTEKLLSEGYDLVYGSSDFFPDVVPCYKYKRRFPKTKWVQCIHHCYPGWWSRPGNKLFNLIGFLAQKYSFSLIKEKAELVVCVSYSVKKDLLRLGFDTKKIVVNPNGVDVDFLSSLSATKRSQQAAFLARLSPSKGIFDLPEIWQKVLKEVPKANLKIIGDGSDALKEKLRHKFADLNLTERVEICGYLPDKEAFKMVKESGVFILPSHEEGFGIVIAEALACEVPVVAWDLDIYKEVFQSGVVLASEGNHDGFAKAVIKILNDKPYALSIAKEGFRMVMDKYSWDGVANRELDLIENVLNERPVNELD